jgi:lipid-A-disaccharide synthase
MPQAPRPKGELRRTLVVLWLAVGAFFSFLPFLLNLLLSLVVGGRFRRRVRALLETTVDVDEPEAGGTKGTVYVIAGEDSGDLHAANLVRGILERAPDVEVRGMGGPRMAEAGCRLDYDLVRMNVMGVLPVLRAVGTFFGLFRDLLRRLETDPPDVLVPVDYPGFNLRAARLARRCGVAVVYYIAPQVWAWAPWRIRRIARSVDRMLVILPFERPLFADSGLDCRFTGHPLYEHLEQEAPAGEAREMPVRIGILPGSRRAEVRSLLPDMLRAAQSIRGAGHDVSFVIPHQRPELKSEIEREVAGHGEGLPIEIVSGRTHATMRDLDMAMVASGTATLELAYYRVPMVVLYRVSRIGALLKRVLLITPHVALVNIVGGGRVVPEFIGAGDLATPAADALTAWLNDAGRREETRQALEGVRARLRFEDPSGRAAGWVLRQLRDD